MANADPNRLESLANKLGDALTRRIDIVSTALTPQGQRPPFTEQMSQQDALKFWLDNWDQPYMKPVMDRLDPLSRLQLHNAVTQYMEDNRVMQNPTPNPPVTEPQPLTAPPSIPGGLPAPGAQTPPPVPLAGA
jgi:hypothetical protein